MMECYYYCALAALMIGPILMMVNRRIIDQLLGGKLAANVGSAIEGMYHAHCSSMEKLIHLSLQPQGASCKADYGRRQ